MKNEPLNQRQKSNKARRAESIRKVYAAIRKAGPDGISRAEIKARSGVLPNAFAAVLAHLRDRKRVRICGHFQSRTQRLPLFAVGSEPDAKLVRLPPKERDRTSMPNLEKSLKKEVNRQHEKWLKEWTPRRDPAAAWIGGSPMP
jgi:hypothetical protein